MKKMQLIEQLYGTLTIRKFLGSFLIASSSPSIRSLTGSTTITNNVFQKVMTSITPFWNNDSKELSNEYFYFIDKCSYLLKEFGIYFYEFI